MKFTKPLFTTALFFATTSIALAATDTTDIQINVTKDAFVNLVGSAVGSSSTFTTDDIDNATVSLGTLGLESNSSGDCDISFSSANNYKLNHEVTGETLVDYAISYAGVSNDGANTNNVTTSCNTVASSLDLVSPAMPATINAGLYKDVVTVTVVTQ